MARYRVLFKAPESNRERLLQSQNLEEICNKEFFLLFGKKNALEAVKRHGEWIQIPVVCCNIDSGGYYTLECNDPELSDERLDELQKKIRAWHGTGLLPRS